MTDLAEGGDSLTGLRSDNDDDEEEEDDDDDDDNDDNYSGYIND